jgi:hypothetical protein
MRVRLNSILFGSMLVVFAFATASAQDTNFSTGPQYLANNGPSIYARPISTPTLSLAGPPVQAGASDVTGLLIPGAEDEYVSPPRATALPKIDLFPIFYGNRPASVIEIGFAAPSGLTVPESILDTGVTQETTAKALRERGYGVALGEAAAVDRMLTRHAVRVYTNADIDRLHPGS